MAILVSTMNDVPGYRIERVLGEVTGLTVRSRNIGAQLGAGLKSILGGELKGLTKQLQQSRDEAVDGGRAGTRRQRRHRRAVRLR